MRYPFAACPVAITLAAAACFAQATTNPAGPGKPPAAPPAAPEVQPENTDKGWWNDAVFYEVFVRSFADSKTGPLANDGVGDIQGLIEHLDYIRDLGVGALWLMPVTQSPSYHGYDTTDYRAIESDYGTNDDFKRLMAECHKRNIKVVIDMVLNHCSSKHPWFIEAQKGPDSPKRDWFIWEKARPAWKGPWNETVWHPNPAPGQRDFYYGMFNHDMPDLNYRNALVTAEMRDTAKFWLTEMGVDGFRLDAVRHLIEDGKVQENTPETHAWLADFQKACKAVKPDCFTVGEIWAGTRDISGYVNGHEMDSAFEFELESKLIEAVKTGKSKPLLDAFKTSWYAFPKGAYSTFLTNHDQGRIMTAVKGDSWKAKTGASILLTMPGIPFLYYGEEIGMTGDKPDPKIRTPMQWTAAPTVGFTTGKPWQPPNADAAKTNVEVQAPIADSLLNHYKRLIKVRNSSAALRAGGIQILEQTDATLLAFVRTTPDETVLVVINLGSSPKHRRDVKEIANLRCINTGTDLFTGLPDPDWARQVIQPGEVWLMKMGCGPGEFGPEGR
jgi:glycosidase